MQLVNVTCTTHGAIQVRSDSITLMLCRQISKSYYKFYCTGCSDEVHKPADEHITALLVLVDVTVIRWVEASEVIGDYRGARINDHDILDFALALDRTDYLSVVA